MGTVGPSGNGRRRHLMPRISPRASDDPVARAEHLRRCGPCAEVTRELRGEPAVGPDLELRLLRGLPEWRDT